MWTYYVCHDLKPELLSDLPSAKSSVSTPSDRCEPKTTEGANAVSEETSNTEAAAKPNTASSATETTLKLHPETTTDSTSDEPNEVIPSTNGQDDNNVADAKVIEKPEHQTTESDLTTSSNPAMTNGQDGNLGEETTAPATVTSSNDYNDAHLSEALKSTNGNMDRNGVEHAEASTNSTPTNNVAANGKSENGTSEVCKFGSSGPSYNCIISLNQMFS